MKISVFINKVVLKVVESINKRVNRANVARLLNGSHKIILGERFEFDFIKSDFSIKPGAEFKTGKNVTFRSFCNVLIYGSARLQIGENVFFNRYCSINCLGNIEIGNDVMFGEGVKLYDHNHKYKDTEKIIRQQGIATGSITIGNNCWIGANVTILNNVTIGNNVIIGAGNLIFKSIPSNTIIKSQAAYINEPYNTNL